MAIMIEKADQIAKNFVNGYAQTELLPGGYACLQNYKCFLKAGSSVTPEIYSDKAIVYVFSRGKGYVSTETNQAFNITELSFFSPGLLGIDGVAFSIHAEEDMEFLRLVYTMTEKDMERYHRWRIRFPYFQPLSTCVEYVQDCKTGKAHSWSVLNPKNVGRIIMGVVRAEGDGEGTVEKGHPAVAQFNYALPGSDFTLNIDGETVRQCDGDWSFVPAGPDHSLISNGEGKPVYYIWFEHIVDELP